MLDTEQTFWYIRLKEKNMCSVFVFAMEDKDMKKQSRREIRHRKEQITRRRRRRVCARLMLLFSTLALLTALGVNFIGTAFAFDSSQRYSVKVAPGDTLWSIAQEYNTKNRDIRAVVDSIIRANDLDSTELHVGDKLIIPVK